jgi:hypothetical protein
MKMIPDTLVPDNSRNTLSYNWTIEEGLAAGAACREAGLDGLARGWSMLALCPPDHCGVRLVSRNHSKKCRSPGKAPWHTWGEYELRCPTEDELRHWFGQLANSNLGCALGPVSGMVRIDVDGEGGAALLRELCGGEPPATLAFTSGQPGNLGLLYAHPPGLELHTKAEGLAIGEHNELRLQGKGAQTCLPPSRHNKGTLYRWLPGYGPGEIAAAPLPDWAVGLMLVKPQEPTTACRSVCASSDKIAMALSALAGLAPARANDRDDWLRVGFALHSVCDDDVMLQAWIAWSRQSGKFTEGECATMWLKFNAQRPGNHVTLGTLIYLAKKDGWRPPPPRVRRTGRGKFTLDFTL